MLLAEIERNIWFHGQPKPRPKRYSLLIPSLSHYSAVNKPPVDGTERRNNKRERKKKGERKTRWVGKVRGSNNNNTQHKKTTTKTERADRRIESNLRTSTVSILSHVRWVLLYIMAYNHLSRTSDPSSVVSLIYECLFSPSFPPFPLVINAVPGQRASHVNISRIIIVGACMVRSRHLKRLFFLFLSISLLLLCVVSF